MKTIYDLPKPGNIALKRSKALSEYILQAINQQNGAISFAHFMELALYHPELGYYNANTFTLGAHGDFTTAPELSPLFAACFAKPIQQIADHLHTNQILELGAGTGQFAKDLLYALNQRANLPQHYYIYEISPGLRKKQQTFLRNACPEFFSRITWLETLPKHFVGCVIANEVLDALPVHCFRIETDGILERCVSSDNDMFVWQSRISTNNELIKQASTIADLYSLPSGYESEINLNMQSFIQSVADAVDQGIIFFVDYGYGAAEYYHPERHRGTLSCFYQHRYHANPLILPGLQDITAHVNFSAAIECAAEHGCNLAGYTSQAAFLLACGLMDLAADLEKNLSPADEFKLHSVIKQLTLPTEMGERIKVMALSKHMNKNKELSLFGFELQDRRREL